MLEAAAPSECAALHGRVHGGGEYGAGDRVRTKGKPPAVLLRAEGT